LGRRSQRLARAAAITAATTGLITEATRDAEPFGFCLATGGPGELVCLDSFYIGKLKGVGKVYLARELACFTTPKRFTEGLGHLLDGIERTKVVMR
jgi:hypothetical protein